MRYKLFIQHLLRGTQTPQTFAGRTGTTRTSRPGCTLLLPSLRGRRNFTTRKVELPPSSVLHAHVLVDIPSFLSSARIFKRD